MPNLIVPIYSMRSYDTGQYSILKDGNWKLQISRMDWDNDYIAVPKGSSDIEEFARMRITKNIIQLEYGTNAYNTREMFWATNLGTVERVCDELGLDLVTDITGYPGKRRFINNFNITKDPDHPRWYIDEFFETDLDSIRRAEMTYVLNQGQKDYLLSVDPSLKITVTQKVIRDEYYKRVMENVPFTETNLDFDVFFPFRISDPAYKFEDVVKTPNRILITDPNDSYKEKYVNVQKIKFTKVGYYDILSQRPKIIYLENPEKVFHPGLADFIYFNCDIESPYKIPTLDEVLIEESSIPFYRWS